MRRMSMETGQWRMHLPQPVHAGSPWTSGYQTNLCPTLFLSLCHSCDRGLWPLASSVKWENMHESQLLMRSPPRGPLLVGNIEALAGGAEVGAGPAAEALFRRPPARTRRKQKLGADIRANAGRSSSAASSCRFFASSL